MLVPVFVGSGEIQAIKSVAEDRADLSVWRAVSAHSDLPTWTRPTAESIKRSVETPLKTAQIESLKTILFIRVCGDEFQLEGKKKSLWRYQVWFFFFSFIYWHECLCKAAGLVFMVSYTLTPINSSFSFCKINRESWCGSRIKNQERGLEWCLEPRWNVTWGYQAGFPSPAGFWQAAGVRVDVLLRRDTAGAIWKGIYTLFPDVRTSETNV